MVVKAEVRTYALHMLGRKNRDDPFPPLPTTDELELFKHRKLGGPTAEDFRIDVSGKNPGSEWNKRGAAIFAERFLAHHHLNKSNFDQIHKTFLTHIRALSYQFKKMKQSENSESLHDRPRYAEAANIRRARRGTVGLCHHILCLKVLIAFI